MNSGEVWGIKKIDIYPILFFFFLSLFVLITSIRGPYLIRFVDERWPVNSVGDLIRVFGAWDSQGMGSNYTLNIFLIPSTFLPEAFLALIGIPSYVSQYILLSLFNFISLYFFYLFLYEFIFSNVDTIIVRKFISILGSTLFVFNFATIIYYWFDATPNGQFTIAMTAMEVYYSGLAISEYIDGTVNVKNWILLSVISGLAFSGNTPMNVSPLMISLTFPLLAVLLSKNLHIKRIVKFYFSYFLIIITTNVWWFIESFTASKGLPNYSSSSNLYTLFFDSTGLTFRNVIRGMYLYLYNVLNLSPTAGWDNLTKSIYVLAGNLLYIMPIVILICVIVTAIGTGVKIRTKDRISELPSVRTYLATSAIFVFLILFIMGTNSPLLLLYKILFRIPVLSLILRDPAWTFGEAFYVYIILLFLLSLINIFKYMHFLRGKIKIKKFHFKAKLLNRAFHSRNIRALIAIVIIFLLAFPVLMENSAYYTGDAIPSSPYKDRFAPPAFDIATIDFLEYRTLDHYALLVPGGFQILNISHGYDSFDYIASSLPNNLIISGSGNNVTNLIYNVIESGTSYEYPNFYQTLINFNIKYIVIEGDMVGYPFNLKVLDYSAILGSLNHTYGITLERVFPPNYIYEVSGNSGLISVSNNYLSNTSFGPFNTIPIYNITKAYYDLTQVSTVNFNPYTIIRNATYENNTISISLNNTFKNYFYNETGHNNYATAIGTRLVLPTYMNIIPMNINATQFPYLFIKFKTNINTVISIDLITTQNIGKGFYSKYVESSMYQVGYSFSNVYSTLYVINRYTSPYHYTLLVDNMQAELNYFNANKTVYYIAIRIFPLENNGSQFSPSIPGILSWPGYQNVTISDISLGINYYYSTNIFNISRLSIIKNVSFANEITYYNTSFLNELRYNGYQYQYVKNGLYIINGNYSEISNVSHEFNVKYDKISNENYKVTISNLNLINGMPILVVFKDNYDPSWIITNTIGIIKYKHVIVDGSLNGFLIWVNASSNEISFRIYYLAQTEYEEFIYLGLFLYVIPLATLGFLYFYKKRRY